MTVGWGGWRDDRGGMTQRRVDGKREDMQAELAGLSARQT